MTAPDPRMPDMPSDAERSRGRYVHVRGAGAAGDADVRARVAPAGVDERWVAGHVGPDAVRIRSTRVAAAPTSRLEVDVRLAGAASSAVLRWTGSGDGVIRAATVECVVVDGQVEVRRTLDGEVYAPVRVDGPLLLPALVLAGRLVPGRASAFVVGDARDAAEFLLPVPVEVDVRDVGRVDVDGVEGAVRRWRVTGGVELDGEDVVDDAGLLIRRTTGDVTATSAEVAGPALAPASWTGDGLLPG